MSAMVRPAGPDGTARNRFHRRADRRHTGGGARSGQGDAYNHPPGVRRTRRRGRMEKRSSEIRGFRPAEGARFRTLGKHTVPVASEAVHGTRKQILPVAAATLPERRTHDCRAGGGPPP
ncbi:hypothetical protein GCM10010420_30670 [Streptomyces glaucosporus]|uniref:Uncharacterized protein n=1 Tax=Streptomyces glaucosporus TaxID=284044 RepID=A0ABP5VF93_9ACTN